MDVISMTKKMDGDDLAIPPVMVPKKRGRPSNPDKPKKVPTGRGRGRPSKSGNNSMVMKKQHGSEGEEDEAGMSGGDMNNSSVVSNGRGRPAKIGRPKLSHSIEATGKGRGRPKKMKAADYSMGSGGEGGDGIEEEDYEEDDYDRDSGEYKPNRKVAKKISKKARGRPRKVKNSEGESSEDDMDDEERRGVGRPSSGGISLNIERTGRGQGRPKKEMAAKHRNDGGSESSPKKRGRPPGGNKSSTTYVPTGKARGRPKSNNSNMIMERDQDNVEYIDNQSENSNQSDDSQGEIDRLEDKKSDGSDQSGEDDDLHSDSEKDDNDD